MSDHQDKIPRVFCVGTADTKLEEIQFLSESVHSNLNIFYSNLSSKVEVVVVDVSASKKETERGRGFQVCKEKSCFFLLF